MFVFIPLSHGSDDSVDQSTNGACILKALAPFQTSLYPNGGVLRDEDGSSWLSLDPAHFSYFHTFAHRTNPHPLGVTRHNIYVYIFIWGRASSNSECVTACAGRWSQTQRSDSEKSVQRIFTSFKQAIRNKPTTNKEHRWTEWQPPPWQRELEPMTPDSGTTMLGGPLNLWGQETRSQFTPCT